MTTHARLLAILVAASHFGLSAAAAAGTSKDTWEGAWKFEIDRQDQPALSYYDTRGKSVFRIGCGAHFDMRAVYPAAPKQGDTKVSITIANDKTQMDLPALPTPVPSMTRRTPRCSTSRTSAMPAKIPSFTKINGTRWKIASSIFSTPGSR